MFEKEFEKEAEEYVKHWIVDEDDNALMQEAYKDGAEFGYNKAKEDADKMKSQFLELCNLKDMRIDELEKVNEWHYVKDELPSESAMLLLARKTINGVQALIGYYRSNQFEIFNEKSCVMQNIDSVYAWKEIVLPELKESE